MGWVEQGLAGLGFAGVGLYQAFTLLRSHSKSGGKRLNLEYRVGKFTLRLVDTYAIAFLATLHIVSNLLPIYKLHTDGYSHGAAIRLERAAVAAVFLVYALAALISEGTSLLPLPPAVLKLMALGAFAEEFLLFYFRGTKGGLEEQYHFLLLVPIGVCIVGTVLEIVFPKSFSPPLVRSLGLILQGTWFFQIAVSLFSRWIAMGCELDERSEGDYSVTCDPMEMMHRGKAIATLQFNLQMAGLLLLSLPAYAILCRVYRRPTYYEPLGENEVPEEARELFELNGASGRSFDDPSLSNYVLQDDEDHDNEEEEQVQAKAKSSFQDNHGFHTLDI